MYEVPQKSGESRSTTAGGKQTLQRGTKLALPRRGVVAGNVRFQMRPEVQMQVQGRVQMVGRHGDVLQRRCWRGPIIPVVS
jgi:hypothetical protein